LAQLEKAIGKEQQAMTKALKQLMRQEFACESDARQALEQAGEGWKYHTLLGSVHAHLQYLQAGRPRPETPTKTRWQVQAEVEPHQRQIADLKLPLGRYLIATNELDRERLPTAELLTVYKDQNRSVERGFRFLKDPLFFASSFFLKKPARIMGLLLVMGLSLRVYALAEHQVRTQLAAQDDTLPTQTPTLRRIFQLFEGIHVLLIQPPDTPHRLILNLQAIHHQILSLFSPSVQQFYH
jgi:transposase